MTNNRNPFEGSEKSEDLTNELNTSSLTNMPGELIFHIGSFIKDNKDRAAYARICRTIYSFYQPAFDKEAAKLLLQHVLQGKKTEALKIIEANPKLLFIRATAHDYAQDLDGNTRLIQDWSPLEAMFGTGDIDMLKAIFEKQSDAAPAYIDQVPNGRELAAEQLREKFPNGFNYSSSTYDFDSIIQAITNDQMLIQTGNPNPETEKILEKFRKDFIPGVVKTGCHFNLNDLIRAFGVYNKHQQYLWKENQLSLFWRQVIGFLERLVTAFDAKVISQGIIHFTEEAEESCGDSNSFNLYNELTKKSISYFPLDTEPACRLGRDFGIDSDQFSCGDDRARWFMCHGTSIIGGLRLRDFAIHKQEALKAFYHCCNCNQDLLASNKFPSLPSK